MGKMAFVWMDVCERMNRESCSINIAGSRIWTAPMSRWLPELEHGNVGSLLKAEGHCLGGCDDICSSLWPLCGAKYINAVNSDTHTTLIHMMKLFPAHRYTLVESAYFFFLLGTNVCLFLLDERLLRFKVWSTSCERGPWEWQAFNADLFVVYIAH